MNSELLREREAFKKRALSNPVIEGKKRKGDDDESTRKRPKKEPVAGSSKAKDVAPKDPFAYKTMTGSSQFNFSVLAKIVKHMKQRHLVGDTEPLSFEDILDETNQLDLGVRQQHWLQTEALQNNPKIDVTDDGKYCYKPVFKLKDRKSLTRLLDKYDRDGKGGIHIEDIQESLMNADNHIKKLDDSITIITRQQDKKKILYYNDKTVQINIDEDFQKLWRSVAVDGIDETKIEEYLLKQGITSMQDLGGKKVNTVQKRKKPSKKGKIFKTTNQHVSHLLQDYSDKP